MVYSYFSSDAHEETLSETAEGSNLTLARANLQHTIFRKQRRYFEAVGATHHLLTVASFDPKKYCPPLREHTYEN
jgi:hypothetical protein